MLLELLLLLEVRANAFFIHTTHHVDNNIQARFIHLQVTLFGR
jgi:hypothetical protein